MKITILVNIIVLFSLMNIANAEIPIITWQKTIPKDTFDIIVGSNNFIKYIRGKIYVINSIIKPSNIDYPTYQKYYISLTEFDLDGNLLKNKKYVRNEPYAYNDLFIFDMVDSEEGYDLFGFYGYNYWKVIKIKVDKNLDFLGEKVDSINSRMKTLPYTIFNNEIFISSSQIDSISKMPFPTILHYDYSFANLNIIKLDTLSLSNKISSEIAPTTPIINSNENFLVFFTHRTKNVFDYTVLAIYNKKGNLLTSSKISFIVQDSIREFIVNNVNPNKLKDGNYIIDGYLLIDGKNIETICKINENGEIIWYKVLNVDLSYTYRKFIPINNGEYFCYIGRKNLKNIRGDWFSNFMIQFIDRNGFQLNYFEWRTDTKDTLKTYYLFSLTKDLNDNFIVGGIINFDSLYLAKFNSNLTDIPEVLHTIIPNIIRPNPASTLINIDLKSNELFDYEIYDIWGIKNIENQANDSKEIDISNLITGLYFIKIRHGNQIYFQKFIRK